MAFNRDATTCPACRQAVTEDQDAVWLPRFLPAEHPLARYSEACFHQACFEAWEHRAELLGLQARWAEIWESRPRNVDLDGLDAWMTQAAEAFRREVVS